jgi:hypothetical protein
MKFHNPLVPLLLVALTLSVFSFPAVKAANPNILYVSPAIQGPFAAGTTVTYQVKVSQIDPFNAWDIKVATDPSALNPVSISITPNTLTANYSLTLLELTNCVNGSGTGCNTAGGDGPGVAHSAVFPLGAPPSVASVSGVLFTITYTAGTGPASALTIFNDVIASAGVNLIHTTFPGTYGTVQAQDFTISANPTSQNLTAPPGGTVTSLISVGAVGGFGGSVSLSASPSPQGQGVTASLDLSTVTAPGGTNLHIVAFSNATAGPYTIIVNGTATIGRLTVMHSAQVVLKVNPSIPDYIVAINPNPLTVLASYNGTTTVTVTSINNFVGTVTLSAVTSPINILGDPVPTLSSSSLTLAKNQSQSVTMQVQTFPLTPVPAPSPSGLYAIILIANSGPLTHSALGVVKVTPAVFFLHLSWTHHFLYGANAGVQTFDARVQNNSTGTVIAQVVVLIRGCGASRIFARSDPSGTPLPGGNVAAGIAGPIVHITFSVTLPLSSVGSECLVRGALFYGGSSDPTTLTKVAIRRNTFTTNIVHPLIAVNGKIKLSPSASRNFQFDVTLTGKFFVLP